MQGEQHLRRAASGSAQVASSGQRLRSLGRALLGKAFLPFWLCLAGALVVVALAQLTQAGRVANLDLSASGFAESYLMTSKTEPNRGYLVDRRDSTVRRSRKSLPGKMWRLDRFAEDSEAGGPEHLLLRSKRYGTVFLIPVEAVEDLDYPFLYDFVRSEYPELDLPEAYWTGLFLNRVYHGLYLRMNLPFDPRKKDGGSGILRELLMVRGNEMTLVDTRFNPDARYYEEGTSLGIFPALTQPPAPLDWLASRCPTPHVTLLLNNAEPYEVSLLPLPHSLNRLFAGLEGQPLAPTLDERFRRWTKPIRGRAGDDAAPFDAAGQARFELARRDYARSFQLALAAHRVLHPEVVLNARLPLEGSGIAQQLDSEGARR